MTDTDLRPCSPFPNGDDLALAGVDAARIEAAVREILLAIGEDPSREGLRDTPARAARTYSHRPALVVTSIRSISPGDSGMTPAGANFTNCLFSLRWPETTMATSRPTARRAATGANQRRGCAIVVSTRRRHRWPPPAC